MAKSEGPNSPGTAADDASIGTIAWNNPDNIKTSNNTYADASDATPGSKTTHYLKATNFGFSIPTDATINGILVEIEKTKTDGFSAVDNVVKIVKSDGSLGTENKASVSEWPALDTYVSYGSSSDLWSESWNSSDINDSDFGVVLSVTYDPGPGGVPNVDHIRITVYYSLGRILNCTSKMW